MPQGERSCGKSAAMVDGSAAGRDAAAGAASCPAAATPEMAPSSGKAGLPAATTKTSATKNAASVAKRRRQDRKGGVEVDRSTRRSFRILYRPDCTGSVGTRPETVPNTPQTRQCAAKWSLSWARRRPPNTCAGGSCWPKRPVGLFLKLQCRHHFPARRCLFPQFADHQLLTRPSLKAQQANELCRNFTIHSRPA